MCIQPHRWKCTQTIPTHPKTVGEHLKTYRLKYHLMQNEVAKRLGVHVESLKNWEWARGLQQSTNYQESFPFLVTTRFRSRKRCQDESPTCAGCWALARRSSLRLYK